MKTLVSLLIPTLLVPVLVSCASSKPSPSASGSEPTVVHMGRNICETVVNELNHATNSVVIHTRSFPDAPVATALIDARKRGLEVLVVLDRNPDMESGSQAAALVKGGVPVFVDGFHPNSERNTMVIDNSKAFYHTFNWEKPAKRPSMKVDDDPVKAARIVKDIRGHQKHSDPYAPR